MSWAEIAIGILLGIGIAGILGYISQRIQWARAQSGAYRRPQSVGHQTAQTPIQVVRSSIEASFSCLFWSVVLILFVSLLGFLVYLYFFGFNSLF